MSQQARQLVQRQLEPRREQQHDDADLRQFAHHLLVLHDLSYMDRRAGEARIISILALVGVSMGGKGGTL